MAISKMRHEWDLACLISLPIYNGFGSFDKNFKPLAFEDLHPIRKRVVESEEDQTRRNSWMMKAVGTKNAERFLAWQARAALEPEKRS